jgi:hypothetical protein
MRGRYPSGPEFVDKLEGSPEAKQRLKVLLETLSGARRVGDACEQLGIKEARFDQIRIEALEAALAAIELKPAGRKPQQPSWHVAEVQHLRERVAQLEAELQAALIRAEIAVTLPQVGASDQKKTIAPPRRRWPEPKKPS